MTIQERGDNLDLALGWVVQWIDVCTSSTNARNKPLSNKQFFSFNMFYMLNILSIILKVLELKRFFLRPLSVIILLNDL